MASDKYVDHLAGLREFGIGRNGIADPSKKSSDFTSFQRLFGGTAEDGTQINGSIPTGLNVGSGLLQGYLGMKQYGLAKDQFKQNRKEFNLNYDAQQQRTNTQLRDRQRARVRGNPDAYESVDSFMKRNRVEDR